MKQVRCLQAVDSFGVGVVQNPLVVSQVGEMAAAIEHASADFLHDAAEPVLKEEVAPAIIAEPALALHEDVRGITPDEVGGIPVRDHDVLVAAIHRGSDQPREMRALRLRPAVEQDESLAVGAAEQVIGVMFGVGVILDHPARGGEVPVADDEL